MNSLSNILKFSTLTIVLVSFSLFAESQSYKIVPNTFFHDGEILNFHLRYGFIIGGEVQLELKELSNSGKRNFYLKGTAKTTGIADKLFRVYDTYESYFDRDSGLPYLAIQNVREGRKYKYFNEVRYNHQNNTVISSKSGEHKVKENILDIMSAFFYIRRLDLSAAKEGDVFKLLTYFSDREFPFELRYRGKETIETKWGKIKCLKFAPVVEPGRVFKSKDDMLIWYTDDENRIPIKITMEMLVGHVTVEMIKYTGLTTTPKFID
jgi:hypothetical protein